VDEATKSAVRLAWTIGRLDYMKLPLQKRFDADWERSKGVPGNRQFVLKSSRRSSKSSWLFLKFFELAKRTPSFHAAFVAPVAKGLEQYIEKIMAETLKDCPLDLRPRLNVQDKILRFPNGSTITFAGSDNKTYNHLRGNKFNIAGIDEAGFIADLQVLVDDILMPATFDSHGHLILASTPPDTPDHPWDTYYDQAEIGGYSASYTIYDTHYSVVDIENEAINYARSKGLLKPDMTREEMIAAGKDTTSFRREMLCERVVDRERLIIPEWKPEFEMAWRDNVFFQFYHKYESLDNGAGTMDFTVCLLAHYDFRKGWLVIDDEVGPLKEEMVRTDFIAAGIRLKETENSYSKVYRRIGDNNNKILLQDLAGIHKLPFMPARKDDLMTMVNQARLWVSAGKVRVNPRCKYTLGCLKNGVWNRQRDDWAHTMTWGHFDALAALIYLIRGIDVMTNPIPPNFGLDIQTHNLIPGQAQASANYEALKQAFKVPEKRNPMEDWRGTGPGTPEWLKKMLKRPTN
jgi:hypothetical protein